MIEYFETISNNRVLRGILHLGQHPIPVVIVHGYFSSNKIGPHRLFFAIANELNHLGYTVLRFDLSGMGESDGALENFTFYDHMDDLDNAINHLLSYCEAKSCHLIGHCAGCIIATKKYQVDPRINSLSLLSPFISTNNNWIKLLGSDVFNNIMKNGGAYRNGLYCSRTYIDACKTFKILSITNRNTFIYFSENDQFVELKDSVAWATESKLIYTVINGADHNYLQMNSRELLLKAILNNFTQMVSLEK